MDQNHNWFGDMERIRTNRIMDRAQDYNPLARPQGFLTRQIGGPVPDPAWDAFFGAIQRQGEAVTDAGGKYNIDLVGRKGTSGIGTLKRQTGTQIPQAVSGLVRAARGRR